MATLDERHKILIVKLHAEFKSNKDIETIFDSEYGIQLELHQIRYYNPLDKFGNGALAGKWENLFHKHRKYFISKTENNPMAHRAFRLEIIHRQMQHLLNNKASKLKMAEEKRQRLIMDLNDQAEKFMGEFFNRDGESSLVKEIEELSERSKLAETFNIQLNQYYAIGDK
jgi:hypothetical protein